MDVKRKFITGEEWLYYKIYCGAKFADDFLINILLPLVKELRETKIISKWFFIRYADPNPHLRVRFEVNNPTMNTSKIINQVLHSLRPYLEVRYIWNVQLDTYSREIERYGATTIEESESFFFGDSEFVLSLIQFTSNNSYKWLIALKVIDEMLTCFKFVEESKLELMKELKESYGREFGIDKNLRNQLSLKYRANEVKIREFLTLNDNTELENLICLKNILIQDEVSSILRKKENGLLKVRFEHLLASYIHMFMNRFFESRQRLHEMTCYDFLYRYYSSHIARLKFRMEAET